MLSYDEIRNRLSDLFVEEETIDLVYLFGSVAKNKTTDLSDVDVAVRVNDDVKPEQRFRFQLNLLGKITDLLRLNNIDLIILNDSPVLLRFEVLSTGQLLYCKDEAKRLTFVTRTISEYCDTKRLRDRQIWAAKERAKSGVKRGSSRGFAESLERVRKLFEQTSRV